MTMNTSHFITFIRGKLDCKNDAQLAFILHMTPSKISHIRSGRVPVGPSIIMRIHEASDISIRELKEMLGLRSLRKMV